MESLNNKKLLRLDFHNQKIIHEENGVISDVLRKNIVFENKTEIIIKRT